MEEENEEIPTMFWTDMTSVRRKQWYPRAVVSQFLLFLFHFLAHREKNISIVYMVTTCGCSQQETISLKALADPGCDEPPQRWRGKFLTHRSSIFSTILYYGPWIENLFSDVQWFTKHNSCSLLSSFVCSITSVVSNSLWPHVGWGPWDSAGKNTGVGCRALLQGILLIQDEIRISCVSCIAGRFFTAEPLGKLWGGTRTL